MKTLRAASFWITVLVVPGGFLLLTPRVLGVLKEVRRQWRARVAA